MPDSTRKIRISVQVDDRVQAAIMILPDRKPVTQTGRQVVDMVRHLAETLYYLSCGDIEADITNDPNVWAMYNPAPEEGE